jgi:carboxymethylenebutenolidase
VIGYCSGGRQSVLAACELDLQAAVDCYGAYVVTGTPADSAVRRVSLVERLERLSAPLLGLFGGQDTHPSPDETAELTRRLADLGKSFEQHTYDEAGHAFFAVDRPSYRPDAAVDGWDRIRTFFDDHLGAVPA